MSEAPTPLSVAGIRRLNAIANRCFEELQDVSTADPALEPLIQRHSRIADDVSFITAERLDELDAR